MVRELAEAKEPEPLRGCEDRNGTAEDFDASDEDDEKSTDVGLVVVAWCGVFWGKNERKIKEVEKIN